MYFETLNEMFNSDPYEFEKDPKSNTMDVVFYFKESENSAVYKVHFEKQTGLGKFIYRVMLGQKSPGLKTFKKVMAGKFQNPMRVIATILRIHQAFDDEGLTHKGYAIGIPVDHFGNYVKLFKSILARKMRGYELVDTYTQQPPNAKEDGLEYFYVVKKPNSFSQAFDGKWIDVQKQSAPNPGTAPIQSQRDVEKDPPNADYEKAMSFVSSSVDAAFDQRDAYGGIRDSIDNYFDNLRDTLKEFKTPAMICRQAEDAYWEGILNFVKSPPPWYLRGDGPTLSPVCVAAWYSSDERALYAIVPSQEKHQIGLYSQLNKKMPPGANDPEGAVSRLIGKDRKSLISDGFLVAGAEWTDAKLQERIDISGTVVRISKTLKSPFKMPKPKVAPAPTPKPKPVAPSIASAVSKAAPVPTELFTIAKGMFPDDYDSPNFNINKAWQGAEGEFEIYWEWTYKRNTAVGEYSIMKSSISRWNAKLLDILRNATAKAGVKATILTSKMLDQAAAQELDKKRDMNGGAYSDYEQSFGSVVKFKIG